MYRPSAYGILQRCCPKDAIVLRGVARRIHFALILDALIAKAHGRWDQDDLQVRGPRVLQMRHDHFQLLPLELGGLGSFQRFPNGLERPLQLLVANQAPIAHEALPSRDVRQGPTLALAQRFQRRRHAGRRVQVVQALDARDQLVHLTRNDVVLEVVADAGQLDFDLHARLAQHLRVADARQLEQLGRVDDAGAEDDFALHPDALRLVAEPEGRADCGVPVEKDAGDLRFA